jgi:methionyl-tRNA synthetase
VRRNNDELVANYGNLAHRALTFTHRHFDGRVPVPGELDDASKALLDEAESTLNSVDDSLYHCHFREGIKAAMSLAQQTNRYLEEKSPWKTVKHDKESCATAIFVSLSVISCLKTAFYPFLPFSSQKLHRLLGFEGLVKGEGWGFHRLPPGQKLAAPEPLFVKLDERVVAEENERLSHQLGQKATAAG